MHIKSLSAQRNGFQSSTSETNCSSSLSNHKNVILGFAFEVCEIESSTHIEALDDIKNNDCGVFGATPYELIPTADF